MVRFIIKKRLPTMLGVTDLHSNMVRFIILKLVCRVPIPEIFTFQYG